jgi:hypothetical protein
MDPTSLDRIEIRLAELERRVSTLERGQKAEPAEIRGEDVVPAAPSIAAVSVPQGSRFFSVMGRAMLGIAGAYLLRAIAESGVIPAIVLAPIAILYALGWLVVAARGLRPLPRSTYACTAVLILAPMLWELTLRFQVLPAWEDALALLAMAGIGFTLERTKEDATVLQIAIVATAVLSLVMAVATHSSLPFLAVLLLALALSEVSAWLGKMATTRALVALAVDLCIWLLIYIYRSDHVDYPEMNAAWLIAPGFILFAISAGSVAFSAGLRKKRITVFDALQTMIAFLLACCGLMYFGPPSRPAVVGMICLALSAAVYTALLRTPREDGDERNHAVFATWGLTLLVCGSFLFIPEVWRTEWLGVIAIAATAVAARSGRYFLAVHGNVFLLAATVASGLGMYAWDSLAGVPANPPSLAIFFALLCSIACYVLGRSRENAFAQQTSYVCAAVAGMTGAALLAHGMIALGALRFELSAPHRALARTLILCAVALALAFGGAVMRRRELTHLAYAALVLEALKLVGEDLRHGQLIYIAASVCLFAVTLIALPRVGRRVGTSDLGCSSATSSHEGDGALREGRVDEQCHAGNGNAVVDVVQEQKR